MSDETDARYASLYRNRCVGCDKEPNARTVCASCAEEIVSGLGLATASLRAAITAAGDTADPIDRQTIAGRAATTSLAIFEAARAVTGFENGSAAFPRCWGWVHLTSAASISADNALLVAAAIFDAELGELPAARRAGVELAIAEVRRLVAKLRDLAYM
jgi:hypothetical protein